MKTAMQRWGWRLVKGLLAVVILWAIGGRFYDDLCQLDLETLALRPGWLTLSAVLYVLGLLPSAWYWYHLMQIFGDRPRPLAALRAYFMGLMGKYVPGKAMALILRGSFVRGLDVRFGVAMTRLASAVDQFVARGCLRSPAFPEGSSCPSRPDIQLPSCQAP